MARNAQSAKPIAVDPDVQAVFRKYPDDACARVLDLRSTIYDVASATPGVGTLQECLKWGEPAYLTPQTGSGTTIRIAWKDKDPACVSLFLNCRTTLVSDYRTLFPDLECIGDRQVRLPISEPVPDCIRDCILMALTYKKPHLARGPHNAS